MAKQTVTRASADLSATQAQWQARPKVDKVRIHYQIICERMMQAAALSSVISQRQDRDTHDYALCQLLDDLMEDATSWRELGEFFGVDYRGDMVEVNHG